MLNLLQGMAEHRYSPWWVIIVGIVLVIPSLFVGFFADDFSHFVLINHPGVILQPDNLSIFHLFSFVSDDVARRQQLLSMNLIPWWTSEVFSYSFWRPLSELTHYVDYSFLSGHPWLMHVHSLCWYGLLLYLCGKFYRRFCSSPSVALLALLFFAVDASHGFTVAWLANRNAMLALIFSVLAVLWHDSYRETGDARFYVLSFIAIFAGFLSAEIGVCVGFILLAYALFLDKAGAIKGLLYLLPALIIFMLWFIVYRAYDYGAYGNEVYYVDPMMDFFTYATKLLFRFPAFFDLQFNILPFYYLYGEGYISALVGLFFVTAILFFVVKMKASSLRFFTLILCLSILPIAAAEVQERNMLFVNLAAAVLLAELLMVFKCILDNNAQAKFAKVMVLGIVGFHIVASALCLLVMSYMPKVLARSSIETAASLNNNIDNKPMISLGVPLFDSVFLMQIRKVDKQALPSKYWNLVTSTAGMEIQRVASHAIELSHQTSLLGPADFLLRPFSGQPMSAGDRIDVNAATVIVQATNDDGVPKKIRFEWDKALTDSMRIYVWRDKRLRLLPLHSADKIVL